MSKERTFYFCPECGEYCNPEPAGDAFMLVADPRCPQCNCPIQMTGFFFVLIGILVALPTSLILCAGATEAAKGLFIIFMTIAVMRWIKQARAKLRK